MDILYRFVIPIAIIVVFVTLTIVLPSFLVQTLLSAIAGWQIGGWASDFGRWVKYKNSL